MREGRREEDSSQSDNSQKFALLAGGIHDINVSAKFIADISTTL